MSLYFQATSPYHRHSTLACQAREDLCQFWALPWLLSIAFAFSSIASATVLSGHFLPTRVFYLTLLLRHCWHYLLLSRPHWEPAVLPWSLRGFMLILDTQTRSICLFDSQKFTIFIFKRIHFKIVQNIIMNYLWYKVHYLNNLSMHLLYQGMAFLHVNHEEKQFLQAHYFHIAPPFASHQVLCFHRYLRNRQNLLECTFHLLLGVNSSVGPNMPMCNFLRFLPRLWQVFKRSSNVATIF